MKMSIKTILIFCSPSKWTLLFGGALATALQWQVFAQVHTDQLVSVKPFYSHLTTPARTVDKHHLAFENFPGAHGHTSFLFNSLSWGVFDWFQVGTVPLFYAVDGHRWNANFKLNVIRKKYFQVGGGYSHFSIGLNDIVAVQEKDGSTTTSPYADLGFVFLAMNYRDPGSQYATGLNLTRLVPASNSAEIERVLRNQVIEEFGWGFDLSFDWTPEWTFTGGIGESRIDLFELRSPVVFGYGISATHLRSSDWFSRWTGGLHYMPSLHRLGFLFSFDI